MTDVRRWAVTSVLLTYALIVLGGLVSATHSGMGCGPQWPLCNDSLFPGFDNRATLLEYAHRLVAGLTGLAIGVTALLAWRRRAARIVVRLGGLALALVVVQSLLGAVTVWMDLPPAVSTLHLATGQLLFATLVLASGLVGRADREPGPLAEQAATRGALARLAPRAWLAAVTMFAVIVLGAWIKLRGAGMACGPEFPLCRGSLLPPSADAGTVLNWTHRVGAVLATVTVLALFAGIRRVRDRRPRLYAVAWLAVTVLAGQLALGALTALALLNPALSAAHLAAATLLLGLLAWITAQPLLARAGPLPAGDTAGGAERVAAALRPAER